jgi:hypothetical protein
MGGVTGVVDLARQAAEASGQAGEAMFDVTQVAASPSPPPPPHRFVDALGSCWSENIVDVALALLTASLRRSTSARHRRASS